MSRVLKGIVRMIDKKDTNPKDSCGIQKVPMHVVPTKPLLEVGLAMLEGSRKYGSHNFRDVGVRFSVYYDAAMRHLMDWHEGQDIDPASGVHHVVKAMACLFVLRDSMHMNNFVDDRPIQYPSGLNMDSLNGLAKTIIEMYPDCKAPFLQKDRRELVTPKLDGARYVQSMSKLKAGQPVAYCDADKDRVYGLQVKSENSDTFPVRKGETVGDALKESKKFSMSKCLCTTRPIVQARAITPCRPLGWSEHCHVDLYPTKAHYYDKVTMRSYCTACYYRLIKERAAK
jgi:hypothetical protein